VLRNGCEWRSVVAVEQAEPVGSAEPTDGPIKIVGWKLDLVRRGAGLSQAELARRANVSSGHISRVINEKGGVSQEAMNRILAVFDHGPDRRVSFTDLTTDGPGT
jgi:DNA-binding XRE family transcriptional regulator